MPSDESARAHGPAEADVAAFRARFAPELIGEHPSLFAALDIVRRVADTDATVLVTGESGTGKEGMARAIHRASERAAHPFVAMNCGAVAEGLLESELFGHAKGAFTGAHVARVGRFAVAEGGSLFLDEVGEMSPALQVKLLRVLQEHEVTPLGDSRTFRVDVRVIAATNRDLEAMAAQPSGGFRADLYYRLNVIQLGLPPLRDRIADLPALVAHFIDERNRRHNRRVTGVSRAALDSMLVYPWPGNIRELQNVVERMVVLRGSGEIDVPDLPDRVRGSARPGTEPPRVSQGELPEEGMDLRQAMERFEEHFIRQALERTGGNKNRAAALLGLHRTTLVEKLRKKGLLRTGEE